LNKISDLEEIGRIGRRLRYDKYTNDKFLYMLNKLIAALRCTCIPLQGFYHLYSSIVSSAHCRHPPSTLSRLFYWIIAVGMAINNIGWMIYVGMSTAQWVKGMIEKVKIDKEDRIALKRLLQTVNDARNTEQTAVTVLFTHLNHYLYNCNNLKMTHKYAWIIFLESIINICTVDAEQICKEGEIIIAKCRSCGNLIERSDFVLIFYDTSMLHHDYCIKQRANYPLYLLSPTDNLNIDWGTQQPALSAVFYHFKLAYNKCTINDLRMDRLKRAISNVQILRPPVKRSEEEMERSVVSHNGYVEMDSEDGENN